MLNYRIDTFLNLCKTKNFTQTSKELNITQPAVSQHIHYLEEYYGTKLIEYAHKKFSLTPEGLFLYKEMSKLSSLSNQISRKITEINNNEKYPKIVFSSNVTMGEYVLPKLVTEYTKRYPGHRICSYISSGKEAISLLQSGKIDYAIVDTYAIPDNIEKELFTQDFIWCVCNPKHRLAGKKSSLKELQLEDVIFREHSAAANNVLQHVFSHHGYNWHDFFVILEAGSMNAIEMYLQEINAISFVYSYAAKHAIDEGSLSRIYVPELNESIDYYFIFPEKSALSDEAKEFILFTQKYLSNIL